MGFTSRGLCLINTKIKFTIGRMDIFHPFFVLNLALLTVRCQ
nr:MAG TPA: hypothetical protein [Caudoviricetes sp.]